MARRRRVGGGGGRGRVARPGWRCSRRGLGGRTRLGCRRPDQHRGDLFMVTYVPSPGPVVGGAGGRLPLSPLLRSWVAGRSTWVGSADPGSSSASHTCPRQLDDEGQEPPMTTTVTARPPGPSRPRRAVRQARRPPADAPRRARRGLRDPAGPVDGGRDPRTCPAHRPPARPGRRRGRRGGPRQHDPLSHVLRRDAYASPGGPAGRARSGRQHRAASGGAPSPGSARTGRPGCRATATQGLNSTVSCGPVRSLTCCRRTSVPGAGAAG